MKLFRFDKSVGRQITEYGSQNVFISPVLQTAGAATIHCISLGPNGRIGLHEAKSPQVIMVLAGEGWVRGNDPETVPIKTGEAVFWNTGEWHESGSDSGMTALAIETPVSDSIAFFTNP